MPRKLRPAGAERHSRVRRTFVPQDANRCRSWLSVRGLLQEVTTGSGNSCQATGFASRCLGLEIVMRRKLFALVLAAAFSAAMASTAFAAPSPPTNGGNGAGSSGQCTGPASERPHSCQSPP